MNDLNLKDKVAVITGGAGVICSTMAKSLASHGVKTVILDLNKEAAVAVAKAIEKEFGSFDAWKADFKAATVSAKLSGWGLLVFDRLYSGRLLNVTVDEHQYGAIWGGVPLISCDVFEHAYYHKDGPARAKYIDNFLANLHWGRINDRYRKYSAGK